MPVLRQNSGRLWNQSHSCSPLHKCSGVSCTLICRIGKREKRNCAKARLDAFCMTSKSDDSFCVMQSVKSSDAVRIGRKGQFGQGRIVADGSLKFDSTGSVTPRPA